MLNLKRFRVKKLGGNLYLCASPSQKLRFLSPGEYSFLKANADVSVTGDAPKRYKDLISWLQANEASPTKLPVVRLQTLYVEITSLCNLKCGYCINEAARKKAVDFIPVETFKRAVSDFAILGGTTVIMSGGEPLLHPNILEFASFLKSKKLQIIIKTNGTIFNEKVRELCGMGVGFDVSLDGADAKTHDHYRGEGSFARTRKSLYAIRSCGGILNLCSIALTTQNLGKEKSLISLAERFGFKAVSFTLLMRSSKCCGDMAAASPLRVGKALARLFKYKIQLRDRISVQGSLFGEALGVLTYGGQEMCYSCSIGRILKISSDGALFSCPYFTDVKYSIGNITDTSLHDLVDKKVVLKNLVAELFSRREDIAKCSKCFWKDFCGGGCMVESAGHYGTTRAPDISCESRSILFESVLKSLYTKGLDL